MMVTFRSARRKCPTLIYILHLMKNILLFYLITLCIAVCHLPMYITISLKARFMSNVSLLPQNHQLLVWVHNQNSIHFYYSEFDFI